MSGYGVKQRLGRVRFYDRETSDFKDLRYKSPSWPLSTPFLPEVQPLLIYRRALHEFAYTYSNPLLPSTRHDTPWFDSQHNFHPLIPRKGKQAKL